MHLHAQSNDPKSLKNSIRYSQALRIKTICSITFEFNKNCDIITSIFKERGYPEKFYIERKKGILFQIIAWLSSLVEATTEQQEKKLKKLCKLLTDNKIKI